jgi:hypothetical protein
MSEPTNEEELCACGTPKSEVRIIPETDACLACHELYVMEQTGRGVVLFDEETNRAFIH